MPAGTRAMMAAICGLTVALGGMNTQAWGQACVNETFDYPDGPIGTVGAGAGWTVTTAGGGSPDEIFVEGGALKIRSALEPANGRSTTADLNVTCDACEDGMITVKFKIRGDGTPGIEGNWWIVEFVSTQGSSLGRFYRGATDIAGRMGGLAGGYLTDFMPLNTAAFDECMMVIDTKNDTTAFYLNGALMTADPADPAVGRRNPMSHGIEGSNNQRPSNSLGTIRIQSAGNANTTPGMVVTVDDLEITACPGTCSLKVTPNTGQTAYAQLDGPATPSEVVYTVLNDNLDAVTYTVQEVDAAGAPHDYPWLTLSTSGGPLAPSASENVTATLNSAGLAAGVHVAYLKFTDSCSPERSYTRVVKLMIDTCLTENFDYGYTSPVRLDQVPGWSSDPVGVTYPIQVTPTGELQLNGGSWPAFPPGASVGTLNLVVTHSVPDACPSCSVNGGLISVKIKAKGGAGESNIWRMFVRDAAGAEFGSWQGRPDAVRGRLDLPGGTVITDWVPLDTESYKTLEMRINPDDTRTIAGVPPNATLFLVDGVPVGTIGPEEPLPHFNPIPYDTLGTGDAVALVEIRRENNSEGAGQFVLLDDLTVGRCTEQCNDPRFDVRDTTNAAVQDGLITVHDLNVFAMCATGPTPDPAVFDALSFECKCMDADGDQAIDMNDFGRFQRCYTGPDLTVDPACDD